MNSLILKELNKKLQYAPSSVLERILGYADALLEENKTHNYELSQSQKEQLQKEVSLENCKEAEEVYLALKNKYDL